jgi:hypothetical protein
LWILDGEKDLQSGGLFGGADRQLEPSAIRVIRLSRDPSNLRPITSTSKIAEVGEIIRRCVIRDFILLRSWPRSAS